MANPIILPQNTIGLNIIVDGGGRDMTGLTTKLFLVQSVVNGLPASPQEVNVTCTVQGGGLTTKYVTIGGEFDSIPGLCDAQLKVYHATDLLLYTLIAKGAFIIQPVLG